MKRTPLAFLAAPLIPALLTWTAAGPMLAILLSYFWSLLFGVPVFLVLRKLKRERHLCYATAGFAYGLLFIVLQGSLEQSSIAAGLFVSTLGLAVALAFSLIRGRERQLV